MRQVLLLLVVSVAVVALAQRVPPQTGMGMRGMGMAGPGGMNMGMGMGMGCGSAQPGGQCPGPVFMSLLSQHSKIQRRYQETEKGIESLTTSEDPQVAALIKVHVQQMKQLLESCAKGQCSHTPRSFDPLFRAVYKNADKLDLQFVTTDKGVLAEETGSTPAARQLVQAHAAVVSKFVENGMEEHHKTHELPAALKQALN